MADMGFLPVVKEILDQAKLDGQRLLFSATLDRGVDSLVRQYLKRAKVRVRTACDFPPCNAPTGTPA